MKPEDKEWIDNATLDELIRKWRFSPAGDPMFEGETGDYFTQVFIAKKHKASPAEFTAASKRVGFEQ